MYEANDCDARERTHNDGNGVRIAITLLVYEHQVRVYSTHFN